MIAWRFAWTREELLAVQTAAHHSFLEYPARIRAMVREEFENTTALATTKPRPGVVFPDAYALPGEIGSFRSRRWVPIDRGGSQ